MTLNETQQKVLFKIGMSPGSNALSIAKELDRDQSGINKICHALRKWGLISATKNEISKSPGKTS
jgi:predicted transcriptional regulator